MKTVRMTMAQALLRFLDNQYLEADGQEYKFVEGIFGIFGHGNVVGLGEAIVETEHNLVFRQGKNEQAMAHAAIGFAKQQNRRQIYAVTSSVGPGALNMVTAAATATVNRIPVLFLPGDTYACRQPDPVLQQVENEFDLNVTANDAFKPVSKFWDRVSRPEQLMSSLIHAMRVLTDPAQTGAVTIGIPQDTQAESYDYPESFFRKRVHRVNRPQLPENALERLTDLVAGSKKPLMICGGGVRYSEAREAFGKIAEEFGLPFGETQAGKGTLAWDHAWNLGGIGVTGGEAANVIARDADLLIAVGTRLGDFTTASKIAFQNPDLKVAAININSFDSFKMDAESFVGDAREVLNQVAQKLRDRRYRSAYTTEVSQAREAWTTEVDRLYSEEDPQGLSQTRVLGELNEKLLDPSDVVVSASGSLPGDMQRVWRCRHRDTYHMEYGFSCMGYEINAAYGAQLALPNQRVYSLVGDGGFVMLHSELLSAVQEQVPFTVVLFDNHGFQVIDNLQTNQGISSYANEWRKRQGPEGKLLGDYLEVDYAKIAEGYGVTAYRVSTLEELRQAVTESKKVNGPVLIDVKVTEKSMTHGYESWWRVGVPEVSASPTVQAAHKDLKDHLKQVRLF
ncbi:3D-(3,5/4)-trihydroxycyclohexane-1,2-dione hydrolase [Alkalispirochaeta americana]|uniref:3D-(3,5/4)-trihydroxycyclohexane-1,2-dione hydrolase n=1 Tax=Alkalispirochaeta americana TaxID=159291 RepID=A0A1N6R9N6_9SPIO|nr:3D-(3,5/4)-trihydroxycyclohexane-1,2-dione acylhydrolase (decyclizing) [Alkalispirochaeta americana]SIQ25392.1 3D-(3,5/4)-trihydroxycyclohexane-1,2-dione hydrolase [Alkalispirochaeta americana]